MGYQKPTPILNMMSAAIHYILAYVGYDFDFKTASQHVMFGKRSLDTTGTVEACMIPVLVALSGTFAGLTLG